MYLRACHRVWPSGHSPHRSASRHRSGGDKPLFHSEYTRGQLRDPRSVHTASVHSYGTVGRPAVQSLEVYSIRIPRPLWHVHKAVSADASQTGRWGQSQPPQYLVLYSRCVSPYFHRNNYYYYVTVTIYNCRQMQGDIGRRVSDYPIMTERDALGATTDTGVCTFVPIFATRGWPITSVCDSHQYEVPVTGHRS